MTGASTHNEEMKNLMTSKILVFCVKDWKFEGVNNSSNCVNNTAGKKPGKFEVGQIVEQLRKC